MTNFNTIKQKLEQFIKRYYTNELLKGTILFFATGLLYGIMTLFVEYVFWLNPTARTILFWTFIAVEVALFVKFISIPLAYLFKLRQGINFETASQLIGNHFPEINDKLLNVLQLNHNPTQSDLLLASIEQKSQELQPIPFKSAINFKSNTKYLKYAAIPIAIILLSFVTGKINWFSDSYNRVVNYKTAYEPPAPFQFYVLNESLQAVENKDFKLKVSTVGNVIPENAQIKFNGQSYFLQQVAMGEFQYTFSLPKEAVEFTLSANEVTSKPYELTVVNTPSLVNFEMVLDYPSHTKKRDEVLKSTGSAVIPEGTNVTWRAKTKSTTGVQIYAEDTVSFKPSGKGNFKASKRLYKNYNYSITTSNDDLKDYENLAYNINVVKDTHPEMNIKVQKDSIDQQSLYFYGQASDDYGLTKLQMVYYPAEDESKKIMAPINISKSNFSEFVSAFPNQFNLEEGVSYQLYFEVFDNDALHNYKRTKSSIFNYRKLTKDEEERKQLNDQNETIKDISKTYDKLQEQDKKLEELSKIQKEKESLNFNDKKKFEDFLKRQKNQEQLMKNFNKKLQDNLEEFQKDEKKDDQFKEDLKERLKENEEQLKKDEALLKELEELKDKINKEEFTQKLEELAKQNKNKKRSMKQLLELTKRFYVMKKAEKMSSDLEKLSKEQQKLSEEDNENTKEAQEKLNKNFDDLQKELEELEREDGQLEKPMKISRDEFLEDEIKFDQKEAKEALEKKEESESKDEQKDAQELKEKAKEKQKKAAKKMKQMSEMMKMKAGGGGGGGDQMSEDIDTLRQILENLLLYSFDQEELMETFESIGINNNNYGKYIIEQSNLREHFEHIDDSLFALSLRQPKISEKVNSQITEVFFNIDKALDHLSENRLYQGVGTQQYAVTSTNELASFLSDVLDNMEMTMNPSLGEGEGDSQLPDIIKSQEELNKEMEDGVKKEEGKQGEEGKEGEESKEGEGDKPGKKGQEGKEGDGEKPGEQGKDGKDGKSGQSGENGKTGKQQGKGGHEGNSGENGEQKGKGNQNGQTKGENGEGNGGKNGKDDKNGGVGSDGEGEGEKNDGYGEGGSEEQNGKLFKIYQQQQLLRQALEDKFTKEGKIESAGELIKQMEDIELDLLNTGFTNQTLQKMMDVQHQLLKMENATFMQGQDTKRKSETNKEEFNQNNQSQIPTAKQYFNTTEILNRQALPLQNHYKKKIKTYFKNNDD
ncbi:DUF4175 family protein [Winogradskyella bathintestinalis]|uniref:DUF4175 family protein n=1 Tax=Winogradskyella bathintestinalis TaxID=3035208 RepID=A0ABT7ZR88_9FLAO|nr:DUF4175 family protein [Winogradskyella bathintestinalis]MDN3491526.1 hypothetical protein [Winogradskyella bathintestinalis]